MNRLAKTIWSSIRFRYTLIIVEVINLVPAIAYIPGEPGGASIPLERYLAPCPNGIFPRWLEHHIPAGSWVVDPLASNPLTAVQAARAGYQVLTVRSNPLVRFALEMIASAPKEAEFRKAMNIWLRTQVGNETLSNHLQALYETPCPACNQKIQAQGFIWEKDHQQPQLRLIDCPLCGQKGEYPLSSYDLQRLAQVDEQKKKTRARARQRVLLGLEGSTFELEEALNCYPDRSLYFLMTCINKLEGLTLGENDKRLLRALLLGMLDAGNNLWHWPLKPERPLTLTPPAVFLEHNLWLELQNSFQLWTILDSPLAVTRWPELPPSSGGICLYQRRNVSAEMVSKIMPRALIANIPRPNQAWRTLTVLWSGWLWGMQAVQHLRQSLENRRYDWRWMASSLQQALRQTDMFLAEGELAFGIAHDPAPSSLFAILCAARNCHLKLQGIAIRQTKPYAQLEWVHTREQEKMETGMDINEYPKIILEAMRLKGEPLNHNEVMTICRIQHALREELPANLLLLDENLLDEHLVQIKKALQDSRMFHSYKNPHVPGGNQYWYAQALESETPLIDRLEDSIYSFLQRGQPVSLQQVNNHICGAYPGLFVPSQESIQICLESYALPLAGQTDVWQLRKEDEPANRAETIRKTIDLLRDLGMRLGYRMEGENPLLWLDDNGQTGQTFHIIGSAIFSPLLSQNGQMQTGKNILVFPASRSRLFVYKLNNNAIWRMRLEQPGWQLLKIRHLHKMAAQLDINRSLWEVQLNADPPTWDPPVQLQML